MTFSPSLPASCWSVSPTVEPSNGSAATSPSPFAATSFVMSASRRGEVAALGHEVGVAVELDDGADVAVDDDVDRTLGGLAVAELARLGEALGAQASRGRVRRRRRTPRGRCLQSIIPAPVALRSAAMSLAEYSAIRVALLDLGGARVGRALGWPRASGVSDWCLGSGAASAASFAASRRASRSRCWAAARRRAPSAARRPWPPAPRVSAAWAAAERAWPPSPCRAPALACLRDRSHCPSMTASATMRLIRLAERMASSLPGITKSMTSGSQLVSTTAITGMPRRLASVTAMCSFLVSITKIASGAFSSVRMPPRLRSSLATSRLTLRPSFLIICSVSPVATSRSSSCIFATRPWTVWKLVSMPPSQR